MKKISYQEYNDLYSHLIDEHQSFEIYDVPSLPDLVEISGKLEKYIESKSLTCRIYTKNRAVSALAGVVRPALGIFALASIAVHNIMTFNPDYEIARDIANNRISVVYKK